MVRLGKSFGCVALGLAVILSARLGCAQALTPQPTANQTPRQGPLTPGATASPAVPPATMTPQPAASQPQASAPQATKPAATKPVKASAHHKKADPEPEPTPAPPPPPPTLEQTPPTAPHVSYQGGLLTIVATNSTLSQVLRAVQLQTGASIEMPAGAGSDRVVGQLGPGQPRDVLNTLLNGSKFDYVILGVSGDPGAVQKVILTVRQSGAANTVNSAQNNPGPPLTPDEEGQVEEAPPPDTAENEYQNPDQPAPPGGMRRPMIPGGQTGDPGALSPGGEQPNGTKTPEQLMQELQQMQQQQQQYQQQLNPANQNPPQ
jgi:hypothetical protein